MRHAFARHYVDEDLKEDGIKLVSVDWYEQVMSVTRTEVDCESTKCSHVLSVAIHIKFHTSIGCTIKAL